MRFFTYRLAIILSVLCATASAAVGAPANVSHIYNFSASYADQFGGPAMVPVGSGGALTASEYVFPGGDGLDLSNAINPNEYSIEMLFQISFTGSWVKFIDFKNLTDDYGLYNDDTALYFYDIDGGSSGVITAGATIHLVLTRNGTSGELAGYIDGAPQFSFTDSGNDAVFDAPQNIIYFFVDDTTTSGGEVSAGSVDYIRIYNGVLTPAQVTSLYNGGTPPGMDSLPAASPVGLLVLSLLLCAASVILLRRRTTES